MKLGCVGVAKDSSFGVRTLAFAVWIKTLNFESASSCWGLSFSSSPHSSFPHFWSFTLDALKRCVCLIQTQNHFHPHLQIFLY